MCSALLKKQKQPFGGLSVISSDFLGESYGNCDEHRVSHREGSPPPTVITIDPCRVSSSLSSTDVGFILVIDRRQDRWAAVKGTLLRIAVSDGGTQPTLLGFWDALYSQTKSGGLPVSLTSSLLEEGLDFILYS